MVTTANDLIQNLNYLFIELDVAGNTLGHTCNIIKEDRLFMMLNDTIDRRLESLRIVHQHPEWLM